MTRDYDKQKTYFFYNIPHAYPTYINDFNGHNNATKHLWHIAWPPKELTLYLGIN